MCWVCSNEWIGGFFDGEGSVSIFRRQRGGTISHRVVVQVTQNDRRPLEAICNRFGGTLSINGANPNCSRWRADGPNAERFLRAIADYTIVKHEKILLALEMRELMGTAGHRLAPGVMGKREALYEKFYAL